MQKETKRRSNRLNTSSRDQKGRFKKSCSSTLHDALITEKYTHIILDLSNRRKINNEARVKLIEKGIITENSTFICKQCLLNYSEEVSTEKGLDDIADESYDEESDDETNKLLVESIELGEKLHTLVSKDCRSLYCENNQVKDVTALNNYQSRTWLLQRPESLTHLISTICNIDINTVDSNKHNVLSKIVELIYYCINSKLVLPSHYIENLLAYSFTNSKQYANFLGNRSPGGSYTYITDWLKNQASDPIPFLTGLVKAVFDNNQKIGKTYLISGTNIVPTSVMTSHLWISLDPQSKLPTLENLKPCHWMFKEKSNEIKKQIIASLSTPSEEFRKTRDTFVETCLKLVFKQHSNDSKSDIIFKVLKQKEITDSQKVCLDCGCEADPSYRKCRSCGGKVTKENIEVPNSMIQDTINPYEIFAPFKSSIPDITCHAGEPDFVNPNSYDTIIQVIQNIGVRAGIKQYGGRREWQLIECDGLPYNTLREIISKVWRCLKCNCCYYGIESFENHRCYILNKIEPIREFSWLVPVSGLLHLEMNMCRSFVKTNWDVFTSILGNTMGFKFPKAQDYLRKGSDHHKTWHFLEILYTSLSLELMVPYVKECVSADKRATVSGYWEWSDKVENPNYIYMQQAVLTHLHALMMLRAGVRKCNPVLIYDAVAKASQLIYGGNHPIYQNILYQVASDRISMPPELLEVMEKYITGSRTATLDKCQGGDALLEELNKESKSWLKMAGIPSDELWLRVFRNIDDLTELKKKYVEARKNNQTGYRRDNTALIYKVRECVRKSCYLTDCSEERQHTNLDGTVLLYQNLVNFSTLSRDNIQKYVDARVSETEISITPIYVTEIDYINANSIENLKIKDIKVKIFEILEKLDENTSKMQEEVFTKTILKKTKKKYIEFYYTLLEALDGEENIEDIEENIEDIESDI